MFLRRCGQTEGEKPEIAEKLGRESRKGLLAESNNAGRTGKVRLRKYPFHSARRSNLAIERAVWCENVGRSQIIVEKIGDV